ncbi:hypothetical protein NZD89_02515 [Alicyclobacillus fastidiosus]|uniref:Uncharacterized protein n=1 Tax=Alicyclobacillus fastidiosus TaxID=392011 RepID=A0ABY6ZHM2_9BACL|nr:hypothetical protein [Alicyclobacillus fastidiosus]WAH42398.1 hypothetical protein NZD89_02515 [Alicyclobacillus fastidiosus]GMA64214.1 hypothetical protein GCM10025859_46540 [Alicyclobacillus fastidiosus]
MDLDILVSTIITATAALVAIIGGFLVSRVIAISSERGGIERRLREINNDLSAKEAMLKRVELTLLEQDVEDFIRDNHEKILLEEKSLDELLADDKNRYYPSAEELKPYIDELKQIQEELMDLIQSSEDDITSLTFDEFASGVSFKLSHRKEWYELTYNTLKKLSAKRENTLASVFSYPLPLDIPVISNARIQTYREKVKERDRLRDEVHILKMQKDGQIKILGDYGKPIGLWSGLFVLIYSCIVGIGYPSIYLPCPKNVYNDTFIKWLLIGLFFSELIALFIYLIFALYRLTKSKEEYECSSFQ